MPDTTADAGTLVADGPDLVHTSTSNFSGSDIFTKARDGFLASLSEYERARFSKCSSVKALLEDIQQLGSLSKSRRRLAGCMSKIEGFGRNLEPYFRIIEIFCGSHPDWANIALGALRLVLQLASHFVGFFEKLCNIIEILNAKVPRYQELYDKLCVEQLVLRPRLQISLQQTFVSIFEFFQAVANVFSDSHGRPKSAPIVIASLMWKPFDLRFQNVLAKLKFQQKVLQEELKFATLGQAVDDLSQLKTSQAEQATKEAQCEMQSFLTRLLESHNKQTQQQFASSVIRWINPPNFKDNLDQAQYERAEGTAEWIFQDAVYTAWQEAASEPGSSSRCPKSLLWINGNPGSGKTVLAGSIVDELQGNGRISSPPTPVCYYFFNQTSGKMNACTNAYRAIAAQIFHSCARIDRIHDVFAMITADMATDTIASESELLDLICQCLHNLPSMYIVLDGIDECIDNLKLRHEIANWCKLFPVKIVVLSRPDVAWLRNLIEPWCKINFNEEGISPDIYWYLRPELEEMLEEHYLPETSDLEEMLHNLVRRAEGMFLFARVMIGYLKSPALSKLQRLDIILEQTPNGLDRLENLYSRIQQRIDSLDKPSKDLAYNALMWVAYSQLSTPELKEGIFPDGWNDNDDDGYQQFEHAVIVSCRGLIAKNHNGLYKYIHLTARNYAENGPGNPNKLLPMLPAERVSKAILAGRCISYLTHNVPKKPFSGAIGVDLDPVSMHQQWPLLKYASANWIGLVLDVLEKLVPEPQPLEVRDMLNSIQPYLELGLNQMIWVEALYALSGEDVSERLQELRSRMRDFSLKNTLADTCLVQEINDFITDICRLDDDWHGTLLKSPSEIWGDITIFDKSRFFVSTKAGSMESMAPRLDVGDRSTSVRPTFSMSMSSGDAKWLAVLSVFPCKYFRDGWDKQADIPYFEGARRRAPESDEWETKYQPLPPVTPVQISKSCTGWLVTYEIFSVLTTNSESNILITIPLGELDVEICLRQSLEFVGDSGGWRCSVPLSIGPHLDVFTVLDKVISLEIDHSYSVSSIPLVFRPGLPDSWTTSRKFLTNPLRRYMYELSWSSDGKYLSFQDLDFKDWRGSKESDLKAVHHITSMAIFEIGRDILGVNIALRNSHTFSNELQVKGVHSCHFHPSDSLILFRHEEDIYLWDYLSESSEPTRITAAFPEEFSATVASAKLSPFNYTVTFSHCGRFLALQFHGRPWPKLFTLEKFTATEKPPRYQHLVISHQGKKTSFTIPTDRSCNSQMPMDSSQREASVSSPGCREIIIHRPWKRNRHGIPIRQSQREPPESPPISSRPPPRVTQQEEFQPIDLFQKMKRPCVSYPLDNRHEDQRMLLTTKREPSSPSINNDIQTSTRISAGIYPSIASGAIIISRELGGSPTATICHVSSDAVQLHLKSKEGQTGISLIKFPQSLPSRSMSAQVGAPDQDDDFPIYRIILNANPSSYYTSAQLPISETLPMVIRKDARAVRQCTAKDMIEDSPMKP